MSHKHVWDVEVTDTFGREANYSWVRRHEISVEPIGWAEKNGRKRDRVRIVRAAKKAAGWTGRRARTEDRGDMIELRPYGLLQVMFITFRDRVDPQ